MEFSKPEHWNGSCSVLQGIFLTRRSHRLMTGYLIILIIFTTALSKTVLQDLHTAFTRSLAAATRGEEGHRVRWSEGSPLPEDSTPLGGWNEWVPDLTLLFLQPHHLCYI